MWCPQRDSNPCRRLERAVSWASRRWGPVGQEGIERSILPGRWDSTKPCATGPVERLPGKPALLTPIGERFLRHRPSAARRPAGLMSVMQSGVSDGKGADLVSEGRGSEKMKPWARSQTIPRRSFARARASTPSAITSMPQVWASSTVIHTIYRRVVGVFSQPAHEGLVYLDGIGG